MILSDPSGRGRCSFKACSIGAVNQVSICSAVVRITGMALGWIGATSAFASVVKKPYSWCSPSTALAFVPRLPCQLVEMPAKKASGRSAPRENQVGVLRGRVSSYSQKEVHGNDAALRYEPAAPMCALRVADVGDRRTTDRRTTELRQPRHAPSRLDHLAVAVGADPNDRAV